MAHALSLLRWQLYACKTQHAFVLSHGHTANSITSIFGSLQIEFASMVYISTAVHVKFAVEHSTTFGSSYVCSWSLYQVNKLYSFPPLVWTPFSCSKRADHNAGVLGCSDTNTSLVPFSAVVPQWMQYTWWTKYTMNCFWSHPKGSWRVKWPCSCTVVCALAMVASLEIKALNKATRKQGLCSTKRVLYQCRLARSVEEVLSWHHHKTQLCQIHLIPHQPVVPAGLPCWCLLTWQS